MHTTITLIGVQCDDGYGVIILFACVRVSVTVRVSVGMRVCVFEGAVERERGREWISS